MYVADISGAEDPLEYEFVEVDGRKFYCRKETPAEPRTPRRRYSDQFKDPLFKIKDCHRKLRMLGQFLEKHDLDDLIDRYRTAILECAVILNKENSVEMSTVYNHFDLGKFGFDAEEFGVRRSDEAEE